MACCIFPGLVLKAISPQVGALALLVWVALPHSIGLFLSILHGHNVAAIIIALFLGFWLNLGVGLFTPFAGQVQTALKFIEPGIFISVFGLQYFYAKKDKSLQHVLWGLGVTVIYLWLTKFFQVLNMGTPYVIWGLGIWVFYVMMKQLKKR